MQFLEENYFRFPNKTILAGKELIPKAGPSSQIPKSTKSIFTLWVLLIGETQLWEFGRFGVFDL
jgi:hypothetical protein